jgi:hypothetical protein
LLKMIGIIALYADGRKWLSAHRLLRALVKLVESQSEDTKLRQIALSALQRLSIR